MTYGESTPEDEFYSDTSELEALEGAPAYPQVVERLIIDQDGNAVLLRPTDTHVHRHFEPNREYDHITTKVHDEHPAYFKLDSEFMDELEMLGYPTFRREQPTEDAVEFIEMYLADANASLEEGLNDFLQ